MSKHGETERSIIRLFENSNKFTFEKEIYKTVNIGKPRPCKGECKTDIYILAMNVISNETREFKISIKQNDADFLENKISFERAAEIFGEDAKDIISKSIKSVEKSFLDDNLIYFKKHKRTEEKCIKIGWKFELLNKHGGERSGKILMTNKQKIDVYSGSNLNAFKKNAKVNGEVINNSGVANYILNVKNTEEDLNFYVNDLEPIEEYAIKKDIYFACKAINYRSQVNKWDGNRPLSVFIDWRLENNILKGEFVMEKPLEVKANQIGENIRNLLNELDIDSTNFEKLKNHIDENNNWV